MANYDYNEQAQRTRSFKGFVQFQDGSDWYRVKERQAITINFNFIREQHYSDAGAKAVDPAGIGHNFSMRMKTTADLFDDSFDGSSMDTKTLSYWVYKNTIHEPVEIVFVATLEALTGPSGSTSEKYIHIKFTLDPSQFGPITYGSGGTNEITVSGDVLSISEMKRSSTQMQS